MSDSGKSSNLILDMPETSTGNGKREPRSLDQLEAQESTVMEATHMKPVGLISAGVLLLILGAVAPAYAQQDKHEEDAKAPKQEQATPEKQQEQAKPVKQEEQAKPQKQEEAKAPKQEERAAKVQQEQTRSNNERQEQETKAASQEQNRQAKTQEKQTQLNNQHQEKQAKSEKQPSQTEQAKQENRGGSFGQRHAQRTAAEQERQRAIPQLRLSARSESRIPDDRFRSQFGRGHSFRIGRPTLVGGYSRFRYGGYWFGFVQPWPDDWYYTDDVYVDYIDGGYYLCNPYYPGSQVSISVVL
jgi:hypothetical protein